MQLFLPLPRLLCVSLLSLLASSPVSAQVNSGNEADLTGPDIEGVDVARPDWQPVPSKYDGISSWKACTVGDDSDCEPDHYCLQHMWSYNGQLESGTGCWTKDVCSGSTSFEMFDGRQLQFFCSPEQTTTATMVTPPWGLTYSNRTISNDWYSICSKDSDCPSNDPSNNQQCVPVLWDVTNDGLNYANMMTCYNWDANVCSAAQNMDFGQENKNYEKTKFSFYNEYSCDDGTSSSNSTANTDADNNANDNDNIVVDLTQEWKVGNIDNPDAKFFESLLESDIRRMLVVQSGEIVMEYERDNVEKDEIYNLFSATKTMMSILMGVLLESEEYNLTVTDTLGDVFPNEYAWSNIENVTEVGCKKTATIEELLTMTSGMTSGASINFFDEGFMNPWDIPNSLGKDLPGSLSIPDCYEELRGIFSYKKNSNILSYVIKEVTNLSPKEFADATIFPALGINATDWEWDANDEGIQTSYSQMRLTGRQMAKFAQLYLQKGYSSPGNVLLSEEWVDTSLSKQIWAAEGWFNNFGYLWHLYDADSWDHFRNNATTPVNSIWCAAGLFGQYFCLCQEIDRVLVIQRSNTVYDYDAKMLVHLATDVFSNNFTFTSPPSTTNSSAAPPLTTTDTPVVLSASSSSSPHGLLLSYGSFFCLPAAAVATAALALSIIIL